MSKLLKKLSHTPTARCMSRVKAQTSYTRWRDVEGLDVPACYNDTRFFCFFQIHNYTLFLQEILLKGFP